MGPYKVEGFEYEPAKVMNPRVLPKVIIYFADGKATYDIYQVLKENICIIARKSMSRQLAIEVCNRMLGQYFGNMDELEKIVVKVIVDMKQ